MNPTSRTRAALAFSATTALAVTIGFAATSSAATTADPAGTVAVNGAGTETPDIAVLGASSAGVLYQVSGSASGGSPTLAHWVKPAGAPAYQVPPSYTRLAGKSVYSAVGDTIDYIDIASGTHKTCTDVPSPALASAVAPDGPLTPFGYLADTGQRVKVDATGCSVITTGPALPPLTDYTFAAADADGYVTTTGLSEHMPLTYRSYAHPDQPVAINMMGHERYSTALDLADGFVSWAEVLSSTESWVLRAPITGAAGTATHVAHQVQRTSLIPTATGWSTCGYVTDPGCFAGSITNAGKATELQGSFSLKTLGDKFILDSYRDQPAIDTTTVVDGTTWSTRFATIGLLPPVSYAVSAGPGAVAYADAQGPGRSVSRKSVTRSGSTIGLGGQVTLGPTDEGHYPNLVARDGRRTASLDKNGALQVVTDDGVRTTIFTPGYKVAEVGAGAFDMSGNRLLWVKGLYSGDHNCDPIDCFPSYDDKHLMIYDLNTGKTTESTYAKGAQPAAIWGNYLVYGTAGNQVMRRDLASGATVQVKVAGTASLKSVDVSYQFVGWATTEQVGYKIVSTGATGVRSSSGTHQVRVNGARVYYDVHEPADDPTLYQWPIGGTPTEIAHAAPVDGFAVYDETLAWIGDDNTVKLAPLPAFTASPVYLGGASGGTTVKSGATWRPEYPISKPLPSCTMTIRQGTTVIRTLTCPTTVGVARPVWDTRNSAGKLVAKGTYSWALTGSDSDGTLKRWDGPNPVTGTVTVS